MKLYNTLDRNLEEITTSSDGSVHMYNCGPTVYSTPHIGNIRAFVTWDVLDRALKYVGYKVNRVMNITDVGHMTNDEDWGEDKMDKAAAMAGVRPIDIANKYIREFLVDLKRMNVKFPNGEDINPDIDLSLLSSKNMTRATDYISSMISMIKEIESNGFTYETDQAVYFDISKYEEYSKLSGQKLEENVVGARDEVRVDKGKKHPADFVLWMKAVGQYENHAMKWESPWGIGFPGWHIECSAMGTSILGDNIDIHTGGIEHIGVHHPNERAQNYGVYHKEVVRMWVHNEHLQSITGDKLAKSKGNAYTLQDLVDRGFDPMDLRLLLAINNYRVPLRFSLELLENTHNVRINIINRLREHKSKVQNEGKVLSEYKLKFIDALNNDLNVSVAFAVLNEVLKSDEKPEDIVATVLDFDNVFGIDLGVSISINDIPEKVKSLLEERKVARQEKDFNKSDELRNKIFDLGYVVKDTPQGQEVGLK